MHRSLLLVIAAASAVCGCAITWTPERLASASDRQLCEAFDAGRHIGHDRADIAAELDRRGVLRREFRSAALAGTVRVGMTETEAICAWGLPSAIDDAGIDGGSRLRWVYETHYRRGGFPRFLDIENGRVSRYQQ